MRRRKLARTASKRKLVRIVRRGKLARTASKRKQVRIITET